MKRKLYGAGIAVGAFMMVTGSVIDFDQTVHGPYGAHQAPAEVVA